MGRVAAEVPGEAPRRRGPGRTLPALARLPAPMGPCASAGGCNPKDARGIEYSEGGRGPPVGGAVAEPALRIEPESATTDPEEQMAAHVRRARDGDAEAFEAVYRAHVGRVHALCRRLTRDPERARDLTQAAFLRAWERLDRFDGDRRFAPWLMKLTTNLVFEERRSWKRKWGRLQGVEDVDAAAASPPAADGAGRVDLERALGQLPDSARDVVVLHDVAGYEHREIAEMTGVAVGTSKSQLHRARMKLREIMAS